MSKSQKERIADLERDQELSDKEYLQVVQELNRVSRELHDLRKHPISFSGVGSSKNYNRAPEIPTVQTPTLLDQVRAWQSRKPFPFKAWCGTVALDFWPLSDWKRADFTASSSYKQFTLGPLRLDWYVG